MAKKSLLKKTEALREIERHKETLYCTDASCKNKGKELPITNFYNSNAVIGGKYPVCKACIKRRVDTNRMYTVYDILKEMNLAFLPDTWATAMVRSPDNPFGRYVTMMNSGVGGTKLTFQESQILNVDVESIIGTRLDREKQLKKKNKVDPEIMTFWGAGLTDEEYMAMQKKYDFLKESYPLQSNMHIENLKTFVRPSVKAEMALARNDLAEYKQWFQMSNQASDRAKLNVKQLSKADLQGGIDSFSELCTAVEQSVDVISVLPKVRYRPNDSADFIIWQEVNYLRDMLGMKEVRYEEIYKFYDDRKQAYLKEKGDPFGLFTDDTTEKNRGIIENFIKLDEDED